MFRSAADYYNDLGEIPLLNQLVDKEEECYNYLIDNGILNLSNVCEQCTDYMESFVQYQNNNGLSEGKYWCQTCRRYRSLRRNTIFENKHTQFQKIFIIMQYFSQGFSSKYTINILQNQYQMDLTHTTQALYEQMQNIIYLSVQEYYNTIQFDGEVEIDETLIYKRKGYRGRDIKLELWVFGIKKRNSKQMIAVPVINRSREVLLPIIQKYVRRGSTIYSDLWGSYFNNRTNPKQSHIRPLGYIHYGINHSRRFVNRFNTRIHINTVERAWRELKNLIKRENPKERYKISLFIAQFIFEGMVKKQNRLKVLLSLIKSYQNNT